LTSGWEAYLDIETTGLSPWSCQITVIGIYLCHGDASKFAHLVGEDITTDSLLQALDEVSVIYTYNGTRFDLPFIHRTLGVDLAHLFEHCDLMYRCWQSNLYGGLKAVERQLGIKRKLPEVNGYDAVRLWWSYVNDYNQKALSTLLEYNKEDVMSLKTLRERLL